MVHLLRWLARLVNAILRIVFHLLYHQMSWSYDLVAAVVSAGQWNNWVRSTLPYLPGPCVLELGHGPGHLQAALLQAGCQTMGLDASPQMSRQAQRRLRKAGWMPNLVRGLAQQIPFPGNHFNQVVATFPSDYIFEAQTLSEIRRVLRPGGLLVLVPSAINTRSGPAAWLAKLIHLLTLHVATSWFGPEWEQAQRAFFERAGFRVEIQRLRLPDGLVLLVLAHNP